MNIKFNFLFFILFLVSSLMLSSCQIDPNNNSTNKIDNNLTTPLTPNEWLNKITFGINYFNGINENNDNDAYFKWIKEQGFNAVEIGCRYAHLVESKYGDLNLEKVNILRSIIDTAYKYDFYIILSLYDGDDYMWTSLNYNNLDSIMKMINTSYKALVENLNDYDEKLAISFCSEPRDYDDNLADEEACDVLNKINKEFVKMVRSTNGNNLTRKLVITTGWSRGYGLSAQSFEMVEDSYTMVRIHLYQPNLFVNSKTEETIWDEYRLSNELISYFKQLEKYFIDKNIPIYIGEFGSRPKNNDSERIKWAQCYLSLCNALNIKCFIWDTQNSGSGLPNSFAISNKQKLCWLNPEYMNYILDLVKNKTYNDFYDLEKQLICLNDEIILPKTITNIFTNEKTLVSFEYDENQVNIIDNKLYPKETGIINFYYTINDYKYLYQIEVQNEFVDFELEIRTNSTSGYLQCWIITKGFSTSRLDYDWSSTNANILTISQYSTITINNDGNCAILCKNKTDGTTGILYVTIEDGKITEYHNAQIKK